MQCVRLGSQRIKEHLKTSVKAWRKGKVQKKRKGNLLGGGLIGLEGIIGLTVCALWCLVVDRNGGRMGCGVFERFYFPPDVLNKIKPARAME